LTYTVVEDVHCVCAFFSAAHISYHTDFSSLGVEHSRAISVDDELVVTSGRRGRITIHTKVVRLLFCAPYDYGNH
jgi:hypothetical protein